MKGVITQRAYDGRRWCIVKGEDGTEYFFSYKALVNPKQYKHYSWIGNEAVFDKDESDEWRLPHAKNVILAEILDPNRKEKYLHKVEAEKAHLAKEERKRANAERQTMLKARADRRREYEANHTWYEVQYFSVNGWKPVKSQGTIVRRKTPEEARQIIRELKECNLVGGGFKYRLVKTTGYTMTVHSMKQTP